jgi:hypothetical protein
MSPTTTMATPPGEIEEHAGGHALVVGVMVGIPLLFSAIAIAVLLAGAGISAALQIAGWPALVAGPYAGGFVVLTRMAAHQGPAAEVHPFPTRDSASTRSRAAA